MKPLTNSKESGFPSVKDLKLESAGHKYIMRGQILDVTGDTSICALAAVLEPKSARSMSLSNL